MEISQLGEFGLIDRLAKDITTKNPTTIQGIGDDCAVLAPTEGMRTVVTTDLLMEGIHFDLTYVPLRHLGYKAIMVNLSDVFAMNAKPLQVTVSLAISSKFQVEDIEALYDGMRLACEKWGVDIVGGDTTASLTGLAISITAIGEARSEDIVYRNGAHNTDLICVSGDLGAAYMGLQLLEREKRVYYSQVDELQKKIAEARKAGDSERLSDLKSQFSNLNSQFSTIATPDFSGKEYLLQRQLQTEARGDIVEKLRQAGIHPTAMIDISDGLSSELLHICKQSKTGCRIYEKELPIDYQTAVMAEELNMNVTTCALNGGEDYELLFTVPIGDLEKIKEIDDIHLIGHITEERFGHLLVTRDSHEFELKAQGWNPLK
jgi:thiamine-monophosphate kinase